MDNIIEEANQKINSQELKQWVAGEVNLLGM